MKYSVLAIATGLGLGLSLLAAPAQSAVLAWKVDYSGWWEADGGGSISGTFYADETAALDGVVSTDEFTFWSWDWSGNNAVSAFSIASTDLGAETQLDPSFYVEGTPNQPFLLDGLDQGVFAAGDFLLDLESLLVQNFVTNGVSTGDSTTQVGTVTISDPSVVPEPATVLGLMALVGVGAVTLKRQTAA